MNKNKMQISDEELNKVSGGGTLSPFEIEFEKISDELYKSKETGKEYNYGEAVDYIKTNYGQYISENGLDAIQ